MFYSAGVDEAGRGPVLGPMVMAIVACREKDISFLNKIGVKDSKQLTPLKRKKLARLIKDHCPNIVIKVTPKEIDAALRSDTMTLNELEAKTTAKLLTRLSKLVDCKSVMLDLPTHSKEAYLASIHNYLPKAQRAIQIEAEFKADENNAAVAAASILAKVARDASIASFEKKLQLKIGSGYPSDPNTVKVLASHFDLLKGVNLVRLEWKTTKALLAKNHSNLLMPTPSKIRAAPITPNSGTA